MPTKPFSEEQTEAAHRWLGSLDSGTREGGERLFRDGSVVEVEDDPRTGGVRAMVGGGGEIYSSKLRFENRRWLSTCSCPARSDCKHCAAVMHAVLSASETIEHPQKERREIVEQWQQWLTRTDQLAIAPPEERHELRVRLVTDGVHLEWRKGGVGPFKPVAQQVFQQWLSASHGDGPPIAAASMPAWQAFNTGYDALPHRRYDEPDCARILNRLLRHPETAGLVAGFSAQPLEWKAEPLAWRIDRIEGERADYRFILVQPDGVLRPDTLITLDGNPSLHITANGVITGPPLGGLSVTDADGSIIIPAEALETPSGIALLERLGVSLPPSLAPRVRQVKLRPVLRCALEVSEFARGERLVVDVFAESQTGQIEETYERDGWMRVEEAAEHRPDVIARYDRSALVAVPEAAKALRLTHWSGHRWHRPVNKPFPEQFTAWLSELPPTITLVLDTALASLREPGIAARVRLEVEEAGIDWFDVRIALDVADTTLTKTEIKALLEARGGFVRLGAKGWRRLAFQFTPEDEAQLADLGLSASDFSGEPQRLHALQLAGRSGAKRLLDEEHARAIDRRIEEIRTRVTPTVPAAIRAELRPYQVEGFHFLAYLSANHFGGILADDMGLGKTLQTLAWLMWLRETDAPQPSLVVCPKSVTDNWRAEAVRFTPDLRVHVLPVGASADDVEAARKSADLIVANYAQLRLLDEALSAPPWLAVILDEAQAIKNPESQTARIAWKLKAAHRLALSGTPIENRLLDLWSIMHFAMPGALGHRTQFSKAFDQRGDPLARRRLSSRVRPFVIRRTKGEVAKDLPERIEEDLHCELDGAQGTLYRAELKRARAALLKITTQRQLDQSRFNILTSLLRLRQICCHPALVSEKAAKAESAKLTALLDLVEPLLAEGHKVLVFSQFVEMLSLIRTELTAREMPHFILTGETENRGELVDRFQQTEGGAVFLISLRAGGFGLNLTAASYVVLFDPWWNPAVENQAIDRTHRIGQRNTVIAYRLLVKDTIEEKIRALQTQKRALAADILGEESFARALTLDDFRFLLEE